MTLTCDKLVARLVMEYYDWRMDAGGMSSDEILSLDLSASQREEVLRGMEDVNIVCGLANLLIDASSVPGCPDTVKAPSAG